MGAVQRLRCFHFVVDYFENRQNHIHNAQHHGISHSSPCSLPNKPPRPESSVLLEREKPLTRLDGA
jgi:hypothetical protein